MTTDTTRAPGAQPTDAPMIPDQAREPGTRAEFDALVAQLRAVDAIPHDDTTDADIDRAGELIERIMDMPAPDAGALRFKLDWVLDPENSDCTICYGKEYVAQTVADYRRFLADQSEQPTPEDWLANLAAFHKASTEYRDFLANGDGSDEIADPLFDRFAKTLDLVLLTPAPDFPALAQKMAIYNTNEIDDGWNIAREMTELLAQDAARLTWQSGLTAFEAATAALKDCQGDDQVDAGADAQLAVMVPLLLTPAPDAAALSRKLEIIRAESAWDMNAGKAIMDTFAEDVRRIAGEA